MMLLTAGFRRIDGLVVRQAIWRTPRATPIMPSVTIKGIMRKPPMIDAVDKPDDAAGENGEHDRGGGE